MLAVSALFLYIPPADLQITYLTFWLFVFFTGLTFFLIPHMAWGGELAKTSHQKTRLFGALASAGYLGLVIFYALPLIPIFETSDITPETMKLSVVLAVAIFLPALVLCIKFVPESQVSRQKRGTGGHIFSLATIRFVVGNRMFLITLLAFSMVSIGLGIWYGMIFLYVDTYLKLGALFSPLYLLAFALGVLWSLVWVWVAQKTGKKIAYSIGVCLALVAVVATSFLEPGETSAVLLAIPLIMTTSAFVCNDLIPQAILGEIVDYSLWKYGHNQSALYFSIFLFTAKVALALGGAIGLGVAGWLGYDPLAEQQTVDGVFATEMVMTWLPSLLLGISLVLIFFIPMTEKRHAIVRKRLDLLEERKQA